MYNPPLYQTPYILEIFTVTVEDELQLTIGLKFNSNQLNMEETFIVVS